MLNEFFNVKLLSILWSGIWERLWKLRALSSRLLWFVICQAYFESEMIMVTQTIKIVFVYSQSCDKTIWSSESHYWGIKHLLCCTCYFIFFVRGKGYCSWLWYRSRCYPDSRQMSLNCINRRQRTLGFKQNTRHYETWLIRIATVIRPQMPNANTWCECFFVQIHDRKGRRWHSRCTSNY